MSPTIKNKALEFFSAPASPLQSVSHPLLESKSVELFIKRDDLLHPQVGGNKWRKLKYVLNAAANQPDQPVLTFGGAHSNHISALAAACKSLGLSSIGVVRGHKQAPLTPTLEFAQACGMRIHFVSREEYKRRADDDYKQELVSLLGEAQVVPEGGSNSLALQGCAELVSELDEQTDLNGKTLMLACGTGGTLSGILSANREDLNVIGIPVLKNADFLYGDVRRLLGDMPASSGWSLELNYHFGGYAKISRELVSFMDEFTRYTAIPLEPVYTAKMLYGLFDMIKNDRFAKGDSIVALHTGGLQGLPAMKDRMAKLFTDAEVL